MDRNGVRRELPRDGEPVDPEWRLYARSAGDDKAPIHAFLTVLQAFQEGRVIPTSNLVFLFDGQEEAGSRQLGDYMRKAQEVVDDVDVWLFCDGPTHQSGRHCSRLARGVPWGWKLRSMVRHGICIQATMATGHRIRE